MPTTLFQKLALFFLDLLMIEVAQWDEDNPYLVLKLLSGWINLFKFLHHPPPPLKLCLATATHNFKYS